MVKNSFIEWLSKLDRAAFATLRRSLAYPLGSYLPANRYVEPFLTSRTRGRTRRVYYLTAGLYALHQNHSETGENLGHALGRFCARNPARQRGLERRFIILLQRDDYQFSYYLSAILKALKDVPINWETLHKDLLSWHHHRRYTQAKWSRAFYQTFAQEEITSTGKETGRDNVEK